MEPDIKDKSWIFVDKSKTDIKDKNIMQAKFAQCNSKQKNMKIKNV